MLVAGGAAAAVGLAALLAPRTCAAPGGSADERTERQLCDELRAMRLRALQARALAEGIGEASVDEALDARDPKAELIELLLAHAAAAAARRAPAARAHAVEALPAALETAIGELDRLSAAAPRSVRRTVRDVVARAEAALDATMADGWADAVTRCGGGELARLAEATAAAEQITAGTAVPEAARRVSGLLDALDRCGSVVLQSVSALQGAGSDPAARAGALEALRGLRQERLDAVCPDEAAAYEAVKRHLSGLESCVGAEVVSGFMALYTLGCRNGLSVCGRLGEVELGGDAGCRWLEYAAAGGDDYAAGAATHALLALTGLECGPKIPSELRGPVEKSIVAVWRKLWATSGKAFTENRLRELYTGSMKAGALSHEDISLACGWCVALFTISYVHPSSVPAANESGVFSATLALHHRVEPSPLSTQWWSGTCDAVDVTSARLQGLWFSYGTVKRLPSATQSSWWNDLLDRALSLVKINAQAGLSGRDRMGVLAFVQALGVVEQAAQDQSQHEMLLASVVTDALEYGILHDFAYMSVSIAAYASGVAVALVGRNEGGKVLRREAVHAVLERLQVYFRPGSIFFSSPAKTVLANCARVATLVFSDANKKHMLQFEPLIDMLLECLIIDDDNPRKGQDGADALQEASAGVLHELSLFGPGAAALRSHSVVMKTLHKLCEVGTKVSKERGAAALFELEEDKRPKRVTGSADDDGKGTGLLSTKDQPHVMASYNWDHQDVILRVVASLQSRGYLVWVDTEQMKGATVDTMALAVEGSVVVLIGVSRAYKESSNCRMEAQYALQKKKALVPLMMTEGYEADGWLGLLLGTSMWYGFYGETLSSESAFESRMDALAREIGSRGRGHMEVNNDAVRMPRVVEDDPTAPSDAQVTLRT
eukprot:COSAG06_NODE_3138_length_5802_cov_15.311766_3_plen_889_part_01